MKRTMRRSRTRRRLDLLVNFAQNGGKFLVFGVDQVAHLYHT